MAEACYAHNGGLTPDLAQACDYSFGPWAPQEWGTVLHTLSVNALTQGVVWLQQVNQVTRLNAEEATPYVGEALRALRAEVGSQSAVLGFVGAPFTLASYIVEGGSSKNYTHIKRLAFGQPEVLHALLAKLAENVADYIRYQASTSLF